ncbi:hypothetical protein EDB84DRAFT_1198662 [Lactarius hengduanensis]|nr:hypothetical protein EDB84DRAFT_1198662 [Lactarius hengduanensis]
MTNFPFLFVCCSGWSSSGSGRDTSRPHVLRGFGYRAGGGGGGGSGGSDSSGRGGRGLGDGYDARFVAVQERTAERLARYREHRGRAPARVKNLSIRRCGDSTDTGSLLLVLLVGVGAARWEPPWRATQLRHPPSRSGTYASPRFREQLQ